MGARMYVPDPSPPPGPEGFQIVRRLRHGPGSGLKLADRMFDTGTGFARMVMRVRWDYGVPLVEHSWWARGYHSIDSWTVQEDLGWTDKAVTWNR